MAKASKSTRVLISLPEKFLSEIDLLADEEQRSRSELIREALRGVLKELKGDPMVSEAADWRHASRQIEEHGDFDLILLDLNLQQAFRLNLQTNPRVELHVDVDIGVPLPVHVVERHRRQHAQADGQGGGCHPKEIGPLHR